MQIVIVLIGIAVLIGLIAYVKLDTFLSFILVSLGLGIALGIPVFSEDPTVTTLTAAIKNGIGGTLGFLVIILGCGAMLGKLVADSGAAQRIADTLIRIFPNKYVHWAVVLTGFIVGIPMFYSVGFVVLLPLVFTVAARTKLPLVYVGLPMLAALSVTHGYLPPHPAPTALVGDFGADLGRTLMLGLIVAIPAIILGGPVFGSTLKQYNPVPLKSLFSGKQFTDAEMPGIGVSIFTALLPVILLGGAAALRLLIGGDSPLAPVLDFMGDPIIAMVLSICIAILTLGVGRGKKMAEVSVSLVTAVKDIAMILLIIAGAGALKEVLIVSEVSLYIGSLLNGLNVSPLILAWGIASLIRFCVGSATVAGLTSAGIVAPLIVQTGADPSLMVLATGAGSLMFSHINDTGFWLFKEYFNLSVRDTLKTWSVMEMIVSVTGLLGTLALSYVV
ncbi:gluconate:H+ symporter [Lewinella sp. 4G2]|uniref:gluconate:H+ symporter n=1 Tax=Lewinella sp. 4G2 TaxID=1803372 RepID=UPI0007B487DC|nr:gluconate:H+ symporter [Lewinella sp. 4G2]OAV42825.1 gluconate transporter [Lewinella sp. 4G2]